MADPPPATPPAEEPVFEPGRYPMEVNNQAGAPIYRNSRNELSVDIPFVPLDSLFLRVDSEEAQGPTVTVTPPRDVLTLEAYQLLPDGSQRFLRERTLSVIPPPKPRRITCLNQLGQELETGDPLDIARPRLTFTVAPDLTFAATHPNDVRYRITRARLWLRKGNTLAENIGTFSLENASQLSLARELRGTLPGDILIIELEDIRRINANGDALSVPLPSMMRRYSFVLS